LGSQRILVFPQDQDSSRFLAGQFVPTEHHRKKDRVREEERFRWAFEADYFEFPPHYLVLGYSDRRAIMGSTLVARRAGRAVASRAVANISKATVK
jgi:hypothetical protein